MKNLLQVLLMSFFVKATYVHNAALLCRWFMNKRLFGWYSVLREMRIGYSTESDRSGRLRNPDLSLRKILGVTVITLIVFPVSTDLFAQKFGIKAGLNMSNVLYKDNDKTYSDDYKIKPGFHVGGTADFSIRDNFSFATALLVSTKGYKISTEQDSGFGIVQYDASVNLIYLEIPLTPKISFDAGAAKIYIALGPYVAVGVGGRSKIEITYNGETDEDTNEVKWGSNEDNNEIKRLDIGLTAGAGVEFDHVQLGLSYGHGLSNNSANTENGRKAQNRVLGFSVGYKF